MCGIFGIVGRKKISSGTLADMFDTQKARGPDGHGSVDFPHCTLGHTRLSIIDLAGGGQPMRDNGRDIAVTFNGEIYNYRELKKELQEKGHAFRTTSDTEVILKSYLEWGEDCVTRLDGMFAFAVWDNEHELLFLARDRFGKKPLFYAMDGADGLLFASEIKTLRASGAVVPKINPDAVDAYVSLMYVPPDMTAYTNIHTLPPAHAATFRDGKLHTRQYWNLTFQPLEIPYEEAKEELKRLLASAVGKRMLAADVEIGSLLSGGVDSTLISILASQCISHPLKTFSVGYGAHINELPYARQAAARIGADHHELEIPNASPEELERVIAYFDEPHADSSDFPQHLISEFASRKVKVALAGDGADELFFGYGWYRKHAHLSWRTEPWQRAFGNPVSTYRRSVEIFSAAERANLLTGHHAGRDIFAGRFGTPNLPPLTRINIFDLETFLPGCLLTKVDRTSMMHSLEVRTPFLDHTLAEFVFNLPEAYKSDNRNGKIILKDVLLDMMPKEFVHRRKQGFGAPVNEWLLAPAFRSFVERKLLGSPRLSEWCRPQAVAGYVTDFYAGKEKNAYNVWTLLCLEIWLDRA